MKKRFSFLEGTRWKELARQGKLNQFDFNRLQKSDVGKKYLNPHNIVNNALRGRIEQLKKLGLNVYEAPTNNGFRATSGGLANHPVIRNRLSNLLGINVPKNYNAIFINGVKKDSEINPTPLQKKLIRIHELDEIIGSEKKRRNKKYRDLVADYVTSLKKQHPNISRKEIYNLVVSNFNSSMYGISGADHNPGVIRKEYELRNLLYPSYNGKHKRSFISGKDTVVSFSPEKININSNNPNLNDMVDITGETNSAIVRRQSEKNISNMSDSQFINTMVSDHKSPYVKRRFSDHLSNQYDSSDDVSDENDNMQEYDSEKKKGYGVIRTIYNWIRNRSR